MVQSLISNMYRATCGYADGAWTSNAMEKTDLPETVRHILDSLEPDVSLTRQVARLAEHELRRRLARYQLTDRLLHQKYDMSFEEFENAEMVRKLGYSFEAENDYQDWDLAIDGMRSVRRQLEELHRLA